MHKKEWKRVLKVPYYVEKVIKGVGNLQKQSAAQLEESLSLQIVAYPSRNVMLYRIVRIQVYEIFNLVSMRCTK